jgi:methylated-DNA-protein-cysteine methyltransferase-like protein
MCGNAKASRAVGYALHANPEPVVIPCHRVVNREGKLSPAFAFGGIGVQQKLLESEGVEVVNIAVSLEKYGWEIK